MDKGTQRTITGLNLLGLLCAISASIFLFVFFFVGEEVDSDYYLGSFFTSLIATILSFGFSHIIKLLSDMREHMSSKE